jgi:crossover junction endodeoxyribonuclease RuvC
MTRVLAFDVSMTSPGAAIVEVKNGKATIKALSSIRQDKDRGHGLRADVIESWATLFLADHVGKAGFDVVLREDFNGRTSTQSYPVFAAWSGIERACEKFDVKFDKWTEPGKRASLGPTPSKVKLIVAGKGKAEKDEVADAVRQWTQYTGSFDNDDQSDAAAIALAYLIREGAIKC